MQLEEARVKLKSRGKFKDYFEVIKPRETGLLVFIGVITAFLASEGNISGARFILVLAGLLFASAGANGLTNYLDRNLDARMQRTHLRVLPSGRIHPPERVLYFTATLTVIGLILAWYLHPYAFIADLVGTSAAVIYRKRVTCVFPQGVIASCAPVLMGWFAVNPSLNWEIGLLCVLIAVWLPSHIWSIMIANKGDYQNAGINFFPINSSFKIMAPVLFGFCILLYAASIGLYFAGHLGWVYLIAANISGLIIVFASWRLIISKASKEAWTLYKISAFPYLGVIFLVIGMDILFRF
jgi:protoheme IX farnesyltransferase